MYKWFLAIRYLHTKLIAVFAVLSVTLCVAMVLSVFSIMDGFLDMVKERSRGLLSDIVIDNATLQGFPYYEEFQALMVQRLPDVVRCATPVIYNYGTLRVPSTLDTRLVRVLGIRLEEYCAVNTFGEGLYYNRYYPGTTTLEMIGRPVAGRGADGQLRLPPEYERANQRWRQTEADHEAVEKYDLAPFAFAPFQVGERLFSRGDEAPGYEGPERRGVIVGADVLHRRAPDGSYVRYFPIGEDMVLALIPLTPSGTLAGGGTPEAVTLPVRYVDDSRTGVFEIDSVCAYVNFDWLQYHVAMDAQTRADGAVVPARCSQILVSTQPGVDVREARRLISLLWEEFCESLQLDPELTASKLMRGVAVETWEERQRDFIAAVEKEKILMIMLFWIMSAVAIFLVGCIFYMIVEKKTRDIGVLKALGASSAGVAMIFIVYGVAVGVVGSAAGSVVGMTFVHYVNDVQDFLASMNPNLRVWSPEVYSFNRIPNVVKWPVLGWVCLVAVLSSVLGALVPAILAGRVWPVRTLRYE